MDYVKIIDALKNYIRSSSLPGFSCQLQMAPEDRFTTDYDPHPPDARSASVLILLHENSGKIRIPLIVRADNGASHSGQIALPGGAYQSPELFPVETALREANEEINLSRELVEIIGCITPLYIPVSNYTVTPVIACSSSEIILKPDDNEVREICWIQLADLLRKPASGFFLSQSAGKHIKAPYFSTKAGRVWGATAMILIELVEILKNLSRD